MTEQEERDARSGFAALAGAGRIQPSLSEAEDDPVPFWRTLRRLVLSVGSDSPERRRIVARLDAAIKRREKS